MTRRTGLQPSMSPTTSSSTVRSRPRSAAVERQRLTESLVFEVCPTDHRTQWPLRRQGPRATSTNTAVERRREAVSVRFLSSVAASSFSAHQMPRTAGNGLVDPPQRCGPVDVMSQPTRCTYIGAGEGLPPLEPWTQLRRVAALVRTRVEAAVAGPLARQDDERRASPGVCTARSTTAVNLLRRSSASLRPFGDCRDRPCGFALAGQPEG